MPAVALNQTINAANPVLTFHNVLQGTVIAQQPVVPTTTNIAPASNGVDLSAIPGGVLFVTAGSAAMFRAPGQITLPNEGAVVNYVGTTTGSPSGDTFTGCSLASGAGVVASGDPVTSPLAAPSVGSAGTLVAPYALSWSIYDISTDDKRLNPVLTAGPTSVDLLNDMVSTGVYAVDWDVPADEPLGLHEVRWTLQVSANSAPRTYRREFDVLRAVAGLGQVGYALVSDFRAEGVSVDRASDVRLQILIERWSRWVEHITRRFFEPRSMTIQLDGRESTFMGLRHPIVGIAAVNAVDDSGSPNPIDLTALRFYNRHLTQGLTQPDDRDSPRIEFVMLQPILIGMASSYYPAQMFRSGRFANGTQNIQIQGSFGYTDLDGSPSGVTPPLIRKVVQLLVMRDLPKLVQVNARFDARHHHRITTESTRGQSYSLQADRLGRGPTTDPEIDDILDLYSAPMQMAST